MNAPQLLDAIAKIQCEIDRADPRKRVGLAKEKEELLIQLQCTTKKPMASCKKLAHKFYIEKAEALHSSGAIQQKLL